MKKFKEPANERDELIAALELIERKNLKLCNEAFYLQAGDPQFSKNQIIKWVFYATKYGDKINLERSLKALGPEAKSILNLKRKIYIDGEEYNLTPFGVGIYTRQLGLCQYLYLQAPIEITFQMLRDAAKRTSRKIFSFLLKKSALDARALTELLFFVVSDARAGIIKELLTAGANIDKSKFSVNSCLGLTIISGNMAAFKIFLALTSDINLPNENIHSESEHKGTPFLLAAAWNRWEFARALLECKADVNAHPMGLLAPIHYFADFDHSQLNMSDDSDIYLRRSSPSSEMNCRNVYIFVIEHRWELHYYDAKGRCRMSVLHYAEYKKIAENINLNEIKDSIPLTNQVSENMLDEFWDIITLHERHLKHDQRLLADTSEAVLTLLDRGATITDADVTKETRSVITFMKERSMVLGHILGLSIFSDRNIPRLICDYAVSKNEAEVSSGVAP